MKRRNGMKCDHDLCCAGMSLRCGVSSGAGGGCRACRELGGNAQSPLEPDFFKPIRNLKCCKLDGSSFCTTGLPGCFDRCSGAWHDGRVPYCPSLGSEAKSGHQALFWVAYNSAIHLNWCILPCVTDSTTPMGFCLVKSNVKERRMKKDAPPTSTETSITCSQM